MTHRDTETLETLTSRALALANSLLSPVTPHRAERAHQYVVDAVGEFLSTAEEFDLRNADALYVVLAETVARLIAEDAARHRA